MDIILGLLIGLALGIGGVLAALKLIGGSALSQARREAQSIRDQAKGEADTVAKQIELDARNEQAKRREALESELDGLRDELNDKDRRLTKREDTLDKKLEMLTLKEKNAADAVAEAKRRQEDIEGKQEQLQALITQRQDALAAFEQQKKEELQRIAHISEDEAKTQMLEVLERQCQHEAGQLIAQVRSKTEEEAEDTAKNIILQAIQRYASEHTATSVTNAVELPSDELKGRIIGREGRNIRSFEQATGVDLVVDDTPGVVIVSCFDPVRRAMATQTLRELLKDGRIHPGRIEELAQQMTEEFDKRVAKFGKDAALEVNIPGLHPRVSEMMGRMQYRTSYGQNILRHSVEVAFLCQTIADELGLDGELARRCGYLHDIGKAMDHEVEGGHPKIGADFLRKHGEKSEAVLNAVEGHHNDIPSTTPYTPIVMAADAISGARPGARRETLEKYIKRLNQLEDIASHQKGVRSAFAIQAGREVRVVVDPDKIDDAQCEYIARDIAKQVSEEMTFPGEIKVTVLREMRTIEYAR
ncbi:MAG: ribonuclease Y [Planctomycetota bacterium]